MTKKFEVPVRCAVIGYGAAHIFGRSNYVIVQNQESALRFYTEVLGFKKKMDLPAGEFRWLPVVSSEEPLGAPRPPFQNFS